VWCGKLIACWSGKIDGACERQRTPVSEAVPSLKRRFMFDLGFPWSGNLNGSVYGSDNFFLSAKVPVWFSSSRFHLISLFRFKFVRSPLKVAIPLSISVSIWDKNHKHGQHIMFINFNFYSHKDLGCNSAYKFLFSSVFFL